MHVRLPIEELTRDLVARLTEKIGESSGSTVLRMNVYDREAQVALNLFSKSRKVSLDQPLVSFLDEYGIQYTIS